MIGRYGAGPFEPGHDTADMGGETATMQGKAAGVAGWRQSARGMLAVCAVSVLVFLCLPVLVVVPMSFSSAASLAFPPPGFSLRWYSVLFGDPGWVDALWTSLLVAFIASSAAVILGGVASYGLARGRLPGKVLIEANFIAPGMLPPIIVAVALYIAFARVGLLGTILGLIVGHVVLAIPYVVLVLTAAIRAFDVRLEQVAYTLGASWSMTMRRVVLPNLIPSIAAAWIFAFTASFDEVILALFLAGTHETVPKRMFNELVLRIDPTVTAIASLLIGVSLVSCAATAMISRMIARAAHSPEPDTPSEELDRPGPLSGCGNC